MTEYNEKEDRVSANNWFNGKEALAELEHLKFSVSALVAMVTKSGTHEREIADLASRGFDRRADYLHDSLRRLLRGGPRNE